MSAPVHGLEFPRLDALLAPRAAAEFFEESWERRPLLIPASEKSARRNLVRSDWSALARAAARIRSSAIELLDGPRTLPAEDPEKIEEALGRGVSVRVFHVERVWPELDRLCADLAKELGFSVAANLYVTPADCQGLGAHSDDHDVFLVQMAASKDWSVYEAPFALPLEHRAPLIFEAAAFRRDNRGAPYGAHGHAVAGLGPPTLRATLHPGDLLYLPRGAVHWAKASGGTSVHVTIGVHATTWADLAALAVERASRDDVRLRETLPPGAMRVAPDGDWLGGEFRSRTQDVFASVPALDAFEELAARFLNARGPAAEAKAASDPFDPEREYRLDDGMLVVRRGETLALRRFRKGADDVVLPSAFADAIQEMRARPRFRLGQLETLSRRSTIALGRELHRNGLLVEAP